MKIEVIKKDSESELQFPCLMIAEEPRIIVLFTCLKKGTVVVRNNYWDVGHYSENWTMSQFSSFKGKITLENE